MMSFPSQIGVRARALVAQSKVGVVSLASVADAVSLSGGLEAFREGTGWDTECASTEPMGDFAGTPEARNAALMSLWQRKDIDAIVCARGGYGSNYLCPFLIAKARSEALHAHPKAFVGYSDNTSVLLALDRAGVASFHGPMVASDFACGRADIASFRAALCGEPLDYRFGGNSGVQSIVDGFAEGTMIGGCLSVVVTSLGTPWEIETRGRILFLEDVNEKPFRIDRMLMHLLQAGKFFGVCGVVFGAMTGCAPATQGEESVVQVIRRVLGGLGIPVAFGVPSGHVAAGNLTLPFGVPARLESSQTAVRLHVEPAAVTDSE